MRNIKTKLLITAIITIAILRAGLAWIGSDLIVEIISPADNTETNLPINLKIKQYNNTQGVDYVVYYIVEDADNNSTISLTGWNNRKEVARVTDINEPERVISAGFFGESFMELGKHYFILGVGVDLNGDATCDTSLIVGETNQGGGASGIKPEAINRFKAVALKP
jgi:hypothetical protein